MANPMAKSVPAKSKCSKERHRCLGVRGCRAQCPRAMSSRCLQVSPLFPRFRARQNPVDCGSDGGGNQACSVRFLVN
eukprot:8015866-Alexandrium_andersonii.AAC.1